MNKSFSEKMITHEYMIKEFLPALIFVSYKILNYIIPSFFLESTEIINPIIRGGHTKKVRNFWDFKLN